MDRLAACLVLLGLAVSHTMACPADYEASEVEGMACLTTALGGKHPSEVDMCTGYRALGPCIATVFAGCEGVEWVEEEFNLEAIVAHIQHTLENDCPKPSLRSLLRRMLPEAAPRPANIFKDFARRMLSKTN